MDILYEALMNYNNDIQNSIEYFETTDEFDDNSAINKLMDYNVSNLKITKFIEKIIDNLQDNIMILTTKQRNIYFKEYDLSKEDINYIRVEIRTINNRSYQRTSRDKAKKIMHYFN